MRIGAPVDLESGQGPSVRPWVVRGFALAPNSGVCSRFCPWTVLSRYLAHSWTCNFSSSPFLHSHSFAASCTCSADGWCGGAAPRHAWSKRGALLGSLSLGWAGLLQVVPMSCLAYPATLPDFERCVWLNAVIYIGCNADVVGLVGCPSRDWSLLWWVLCSH